MTSRANPQIWRVAEYIYSRHADSQEDMGVWDREQQCAKDYYYDTVAELLKKIQANEFVGEDNHD